MTKEDHDEFVKLMIQKSKKKEKAEPYILNPEVEKEPELEPYKENLNAKEIEEKTKKIKEKLAEE